MSRSCGYAIAGLAVLLTGCLDNAGGGPDGGGWYGGDDDPYGPGGYPCGTYARQRPPNFVEDGTVCPPDAPDDGVGDGEPKVALTELADCSELATLLQDIAIRRTEEMVEANRAAALRGDHCYTYESYNPCHGYADADGGHYADASSGEAGGSPPGPDEYSETNNQVPGVDEADFLKTDGSYIYILADGRLQIIASWPPEDARIVSSYAIEGEPTGLFIWGDRVVVYSALGTPDPYGYGRSGRCTYGYDCDFTGDGRDTKITLLDVADRARPQLLRETTFSGSFISSRRIQEAVFTVLHVPLAGTTAPEVWPAGLSSCPDGLSRCAVEQAFDDLLERNRVYLRSLDLTAWLPSMRDTVYAADGTRTTTDSLVDCTKAYASDLADGSSLLAIVAFDVEALDPLAVTTILGSPGATYATAESLYIAARHSGYGTGYYLPGADMHGDVTTVDKFVLHPELPEAAYLASGAVEGRVLNQFAMDEYDGRLRIATTTGWLPSPSVHNTLSVLEPSGSELVVVGKLDDIAPSEDIRAVRFDGPRGFIVTFKKTDPLFALDLADPAHPRIAGELFIPGFSTYIHQMDATHLMTIGYDADDMGDFAWFDGIQLQIFDIADLASPTLLFRELIGTRGSTSDAATNHLAFNYFPPRDALAIPMVICEGGGDGTYGTTMTFSGLLVYRVTTADGFALLGRVSHEDTASAGSVSCGSWWTDSNSQVQRSIFMDDYVFSVAPDAIKINRLDALGDDLVVINLLD